MVGGIGSYDQESSHTKPCKRKSWHAVVRAPLRSNVVDIAPKFCQYVSLPYFALIENSV